MHEDYQKLSESHSIVIDYNEIKLIGKTISNMIFQRRQGISSCLGKVTESSCKFQLPPTPTP